MFRFGVLRVLTKSQSDIGFNFIPIISTCGPSSKSFSYFSQAHDTAEVKNSSTLLRNIQYSKPKYNLIANMAKSSQHKYDLVVFGATGYTGQYVVEEVARIAKLEQAPVNWAIAGRNKEKLAKILQTAKEEVDFDTSSVGLLVADVKDQDSLNEMAKQTKVVINCVGPYYLFGEPVVQACVNHGSSHVDISGEPIYLEGMQLKYDKRAEEAGVHIVGACGFDSVPADIGLCHMIKKFPGELNSVENYVTIKTTGPKVASNTGTMESAIISIQNRPEFNEIRRKLYPTSLPTPKYPIANRGRVHENSDIGLWGVPLRSDEAMIYRTQRYRHDTLGLRPIQYKGFLGRKSMFQAIRTYIWMMYFAFLAYFRFTSSLLIKYPAIFTIGVFSRSGSDREKLKNKSFTSFLVGRGWSRRLSEGTDEYSTPPDTTVVVKVSGPDPGYRGSSLMLTACAMTILREKQQCSRRGGVMTPGIAFMNTNLVDRLVKRGMTFTVEKK